jgi:hypothetical protein
MIPITGTIHRKLDAIAIKLLAECKGPCVTMLIPEHHPGARAGSRRTVVRDLIQSAAGQMAEGNFQAHVGDLLAPIEAVARDEATVAGGSGFAIFRSPRFLEVFDLPDWRTEKLSVASHLLLAPLAARAWVPQEFFILGISRKRLRLFRYRNGICEEAPLPPKVPASVEAAGAFDPPDHDLENRHSAGPSTGTMKGVLFGTGSGRETAVEYLYNFCGIVDRALKETLAGAPLLLAGVHEEVAAYRRAAKYPHILESEIAGNIEFLPVEQIARHAADAARDHYLRAGQRVLAETREMPDRTRVLNDPHEVLRAAAAGRVHRLCVREGTEVRGRMEPELDTVHAATEDLVNAAVVETLRHGGEVFMLPPDFMEAAHPLAAILRY